MVITAGTLVADDADCIGDIAKLEFALSAMDQPDPFQQDVALPASVKKAVEWCSGRTSSEINSFRSNVISQIEKRAHALRVQGGCSHWLSGAPASTQALAAEVNGPLLEELAAEIGFEDMDCIEFFRVGAFVFMGRACVLLWSFLSRPRCTIG